jgi:hypothetical protein
MTDFINQHYHDDYSDAEMDRFILKAKNQFTETIQDGFRESFG